MDTGTPQIVCRRLIGRTIIITGGGHGLGKAYSKRLAQEGANVVVADIDGVAAKAVAQKLEVEVTSKALGVAVNVSDAASLRAMVEETVQTFGRIDVLVNNAAIFATIPISRLPFDEIDVKEWDNIMEVNLKGVWLACRAVVPEMKKNNYGKIINISSGTAFKGTPGRVHYIASKAAILGFTRTMANELGRFNITVNCVAPGSTLSEDNATEEIRKFRQGVASSRALQRMQLPEDLVGSIAFFASGDSDFITGQTLVVDGGAYMH